MRKRFSSGFEWKKIKKWWKMLFTNINNFCFITRISCSNDDGGQWKLFSYIFFPPRFCLLMESRLEDEESHFVMGAEMIRSYGGIHYQQHAHKRTIAEQKKYFKLVYYRNHRHQLGLLARSYSLLLYLSVAAS